MIEVPQISFRRNTSSASRMCAPCIRFTWHPEHAAFLRVRQGVCAAHPEAHAEKYGGLP